MCGKLRKSLGERKWKAVPDEVSELKKWDTALQVRSICITEHTLFPRARAAVS